MLQLKAEFPVMERSQTTGMDVDERFLMLSNQKQIAKLREQFH
jgi:hypothetical protein